MSSVRARTLNSSGSVFEADQDIANIARTNTALTANANATYADIPGLQLPITQTGTYRFRAVLPSTVASGTGGIKYGFNYSNSLALGVIEATGIGFTASAVAVQHTTTATTQTDLFTQAAVVIMTILEGTFTVTAAGQISLQMAQNTSNASNTVALVGGSLEIVRISS